MKQPIIGVVPLWDEEKDSIWMLPGYLALLEQAGALPIILPLTTEPEKIRRLAELCGGVLLTGGQDVAPALYGEAVLPACGPACARRDRMETLLVREMADRLDKPVLGICRGIQFLNALYGGTLYQDLEAETGTDIRHQQRAPYHRPVHTVRIVPGTPLAGLTNADTLSVNSFHHQGIRRLAGGLAAMAAAPDGLIEAVWMPGRRFVQAVQWHPEYMPDTAHSKLLAAAFVNACRECGA
ncbi:MAG: gamma-glutamyl-gamma-aminobutyrate hydrolase family protein [Clostridiales bacterium]|nr:gamma-glutamyl-gamma-aminobutyrate hydrolase family protein [Clostridiales bacterium]